LFWESTIPELPEDFVFVIFPSLQLPRAGSHGWMKAVPLAAGKLFLSARNNSLDVSTEGALDRAGHD
jgi:hypothetical protein